MAGVDKIVEEIMVKARSDADAILKKAQEEAEQIKTEAAEMNAGKQEEILQKSETSLTGYHNRIQSSIDLKRRQALLQAKQEAIANIIEKAYQKLAGQDTADYFSMMEKLLEQNVQTGEGKLVLSQKDLKRMPSGFESSAKKIAQNKGGTLCLCHEAGEIEDGFLLVYGGIEENCTLRSLFAAKRDELVDVVHEALL